MRNDAPVLDTERRLPAVLAVVLYNGTTPWRTAREFADLVQPAGPALESYRPSQRYHVFDEHHVAEEDLPESNLVTAVIRQERIEAPSDLVGVVDLLREWLPHPEDQDLRRAFTDWVRQIAERLVPGGEKLVVGRTLEDLRMSVVERVGEWPKQWMREGRKAPLDGAGGCRGPGADDRGRRVAGALQDGRGIPRPCGNGAGRQGGARELTREGAVDCETLRAPVHIDGACPGAGGYRRRGRAMHGRCAR